VQEAEPMRKEALLVVSFGTLLALGGDLARGAPG
jgi:hypothetical protein